MEIFYNSRMFTSKECIDIKDNKIIPAYSSDNFKIILNINDFTIDKTSVKAGSFGFINIIYNKHNQKYVIKSELIKITEDSLYLPKFITGDVNNFFKNILGVEYVTYVIKDGDLTIMPVNKNYVLRDFMFNGLNVNKGDYIFSNMFIREFYIMCEVSKFLTDPNTYCIHFIDVYKMFKVGNLYKIMMEFIHCGTLDMKSDYNLWNDFYSPQLFLSIFFAIATYQTKEICHYDLHLDNIFYIILNEKYNPMWRGKRLLDYEYFEYSIKGVSFYIPRPRFLIKIADWGFGIKYSKPKILYWEMYNYGLKDVHQYQPIYDICRVMQFLLLKYKNSFKIIKTGHIMDKILDILYTDTTDIPDVPHAVLDDVRDINLNAENLILDYNLFDEFKNKPPSSKILKIGKI